MGKLFSTKKNIKSYLNKFKQIGEKKQWIYIGFTNTRII
ncbi:hypothetical protein CHCC15091_1775 [Bacillus licheniformis]|nr:hypothetical protein CHCC15091_1775 [Bacillus licheniformis]